MALIVHKYGGTSMGSVERIQNVARRVAKWHRAGHQMVVVPSAMAGETNRLIDLAKAIQAEPDRRELDMLASTGEQASVALLAMALKSQGVDAICVVPVDPGAIEPVLKQAMDAGIVVVTHEASSQGNTMYDIEAFNNSEYGAFIMDNLAEAMGVAGCRIETREELAEILPQVLREKGARLIDVIVPEEADVVPMVPGGKRLDQMVLGGR